jgi:sugar lactone lactonase YvrE
MLVSSQPEVVLDCRKWRGESVIWDDRMLFVTTAWCGLTELQREKEPQAGSLLVFKPGVRGLPENRYAG